MINNSHILMVLARELIEKLKAARPGSPRWNRIQKELNEIDAAIEKIEKHNLFMSKVQFVFGVLLSISFVFFVSLIIRS